MIHTINGLILCPIKYQYLIAYELPLTIYLKIPHTKLLTTIHTINHSFFNRLFLGGLCAWKRQATTPNSYFFDLTWISYISLKSVFSVIQVRTWVQVASPAKKINRSAKQRSGFLVFRFWSQKILTLVESVAQF